MYIESITEVKLELMEEHLKRLVSETINLRAEQTDRSERQLAQYLEVREQMKSILWMINFCAGAASVYVIGIISARWF